MLLSYIATTVEEDLARFKPVAVINPYMDETFDSSLGNITTSSSGSFADEPGSGRSFSAGVSSMSHILSMLQ
jgi:hypothetical protein